MIHRVVKEFVFVVVKLVKILFLFGLGRALVDHRAGQGVQAEPGVGGPFVMVVTALLAGVGAMAGAPSFLGAAVGRVV